MSLSARVFDSWEQVGERIQAARSEAGITQGELAERLGIDRTALTKIEAGNRQVDSLELARIAEALGRPLDWFVGSAPASLVSWRASQQLPEEGLPRVQLVLEDLASDIELLEELGTLARPDERKPLPLDGYEDAESAAVTVRRELDRESGALDLLDAAERLGLSPFVQVISESVDGAFLALETGGIALINGAKDPGRRRFTLAHEVGHYVFQDQYSTDWVIGTSAEAHERFIDVFAAHLQLPRQSALAAWEYHGGVDRPRDATIQIAAEYRLSWSAACTHLKNLGVLSNHLFSWVLQRPPTSADWAELGIVLLPEREAPIVPKAFASAAIRAYKRYDLSAERTVEILRGTVAEADLPTQDTIPLEAMRSEL